MQIHKSLTMRHDCLCGTTKPFLCNIFNSLLVVICQVMFCHILSNVPYTTGYFKQCCIPQCIVHELWFLASHFWLIISWDFIILDALIKNNNTNSTQNAHSYKSFNNTQYGNSIFHVQWKFTLHWVSALHKHDEKERHKTCESVF